MEKNPLFACLFDLKICDDKNLIGIIARYVGGYEPADSTGQSMVAAILASADGKSYQDQLDDIYNKALEASGCSNDLKQITPPNPSQYHEIGHFKPKTSGCTTAKLPEEPSLKSSDKEKSGMRM